jgi:hypothetical protein
MDNANEDNDIDENEEEETNFDDTENEDDDQDALLNHGVDNSAKEVIKEEKNDDDESDDEEIAAEVEKQEKPHFISGVPKIHFNEYSKILAKLATAISTSAVVVPEEYESLLKCESGNAITIAQNWIKFRHLVPLPLELYRSYSGFIPEHLSVSKLKTMDELCFRDLEDDDDYFETCFRPNGYPIHYGKKA